MPPERTVRIHTGTITLGALLKWAGVVGTGGEAKTLIAARRVLVNGQVETKRGRRLAAGDLVAVQGGPTLAIAVAEDATTPAPLDSVLS
ncbi:MAG: RNA-binding S4 domain-containing protein [Armatimonadetes bacterium]|nr:RNA-binding S4 domain-containing protein [Armatimonadota bacterium]